MAVVGTVVATVSQVDLSQVRKTSLAWTSDGSGNVSGNSFTFGSGCIVVVEFIPGSGGTQPTLNYDVDFLDANGESMFDDGTGTSIGANLSNTIGVHRAPMIVGTNATPVYARCWLHGGAGYQLTVSAAGASKTGIVNIYQIEGVL